MARKIDCFISFSTRDGGERDVRFLASYLGEKLDGKVNFLIYSQEKSGTDLHLFMKEKALSAEAVIALFSPDYKLKTDGAIPSGVLTEYLHIVDRIECRSNATPLLFIPVYWRGATFEQSTPNFFIGRDYTRQLSQFQAYGASGEPYLPDRIASQLRPEIERIVSELLQRWDQADPDYVRIKNEIDSVLMPALNRAEFAGGLNSIVMRPWL